MPCDGKIIGGLWYVDQDDAERRLEKGMLWRKLSVRLAGTLGPQQEGALIHLRGWWEKWHFGDEYQEESAKAAFEREVLDAFNLGAIGWQLKGIDSWNGGRYDGAILVAEKGWSGKKGRDSEKKLLAEALERFAKPDKSKSASTADLLALAKFLDGIGKPYWHFLPEDMAKWTDLTKNAYADGGSGEMLDWLEHREDMTKWAEDRRQAVWKTFLDKVAEIEGGGWVRGWCEAQTAGLDAVTPCGELLRGLAKKSKLIEEEQARQRKRRWAVVVLSGLALLGAGIWWWNQYQQEVQSFELYQRELAEAENGGLEKLTALEIDLKARSGGILLEKQWKSLRFEVLNRLDEELEEQTKEVEKLLKRGQYLDAAQICARIVACLRQRGEDSSEWAEKESRYRTQDRELEDLMAQVETLLNAKDYASARRKLNELDQMAMDELRQQRKKEMRERLNCEPLFWDRWEKIQERAAPSKTLADWQRALKELKELEMDIASHPAVVLPTMEVMADQRKALEERLGTWANVNKLCGATLKQWKAAASPADRKQMRDEVVRKLEKCLGDLDGIYDENDGQPCGGAEMEKLYESINQALSILQRD